MATQNQPDVLIESHGTVYLFIWNSENGRQFLTQEIETEPWQWLGSNLAVDHHNAAPLAGHIIESGLTIGNQ